MEQNNKTKVAKMSTPSASQVKKLDVELQIKSVDCEKPCVFVKLSDGLVFVHSETFPLLPNVPLESYIQYTFGAYNAAIHQNETEN